MALINLGEVLYITEREKGLAAAQIVLANLEQLPIEILPASREAVMDAAHIKANHPLAYADAFAVAAARDVQDRWSQPPPYIDQRRSAQSAS